MPIILNPKLYDKAKKIVYSQYETPSAYRSGALVKKYKELGGTYGNDNETKNLKRWFEEKWQDYANLEYPVYRPTVRISKKTPLTVQEIPENILQKRALEKQLITNKKNLEPFKNIQWSEDLLKFSNPKIAQEQAFKKIGKDAILYPSTNQKKKYMILDPKTKKWVHFGSFNPPMEDYTKHKDEERRNKFLNRNKKWKNNPIYTPSWMAYHILW